MPVSSQDGFGSKVRRVGNDADKRDTNGRLPLMRVPACTLPQARTVWAPETADEQIEGRPV